MAGGGFCSRGLSDFGYQKPFPTEVLLGHSTHSPDAKIQKLQKSHCLLLTLAQSPLCRDTAPTPAMVQSHN